MSDTPTSAPTHLFEALGLVRRHEATGDGVTRIDFEAGMHMCHSGGVVQGGFVAGWIDSAMASAVIALNGEQFTPMSLEIKVSYFAPARPGRVTAEAWLVKRGRSTCFVEGQLLNPARDILAKASSTIRLVPRERLAMPAPE